MTNDQLRFYLSWSERMEGQALNLQEEEIPTAPDNAAQVAVAPTGLVDPGGKVLPHCPGPKCWSTDKSTPALILQSGIEVNPRMWWR